MNCLEIGGRERSQRLGSTMVSRYRYRSRLSKGICYVHCFSFAPSSKRRSRGPTSLLQCSKVSVCLVDRSLFPRFFSPELSPKRVLFFPLGSVSATRSNVVTSPAVYIHPRQGCLRSHPRSKANSEEIPISSIPITPRKPKASTSVSALIRHRRSLHYL